MSALRLTPAGAIQPGQVAPAFELPGLAAPVQLAAYKGSTVYLDFWASWCGPCRQSFPWMNDMQAKYKTQGLRVLAVNLDQKTADATAFLKDMPARFDVAFDTTGKTPKAYAIQGMPTSVLIGPDGRVISMHSGFKPEQRAERESEIRRVLQLANEQARQ
ncbi:MAG: TlpA disulfide reductase family protein [Rhodoferax sp.]|nr:TlpA disulfide reductase family protein [Rhodoferax sp.]